MRANEVALSRMLDASLIHNTTKTLSEVGRTLYGNRANQTAEVPEKIGTVKTVWLDPSRKEVTAVSVEAGTKTTEIPWSQIEPIHQPNDQLQTGMTAKDIAGAPPSSGKGIDVQHDFIGRPVADANGHAIGKVSDVVAEIKSGKLDYIVVKPSGLQLGTANAPHAVPWAKLKPISGDTSQPIALSLNNDEVASLPVFGASKAEESGASRAAGANAGATEPPAPNR